MNGISTKRVWDILFFSCKHLTGNRCYQRCIDRFNFDKNHSGECCMTCQIRGICINVCSKYLVWRDGAKDK